MIMSDGLLRVFWPYDLPRSPVPGVIVGWRNSELDLFVLTVLEDVEVSLIICLSASTIGSSWLTVRDGYSLGTSTMRCEPGSSFAIAPILSYRFSTFVEDR